MEGKRIDDYRTTCEVLSRTPVRPVNIYEEVRMRQRRPAEWIQYVSTNLVMNMR